MFYFEGPFRWHGADFQLGSLDERKALLSAEWIDTQGHLSEYAEHFLPLLLVLERPTFKIRILTGICNLVETLPFEVVQTFPRAQE